MGIDPMDETFATHWRMLNALDKARLARDVNRAPGYLRAIAHGHRQAGASLAIAIEEATGGKVARNVLRPDLFGGVT